MKDIELTMVNAVKADAHDVKRAKIGGCPVGAVEDPDNDGTRQWGVRLS